MSNKHELAKLNTVKDYWVDICNAHFLNGDVAVETNEHGVTTRTISRPPLTVKVLSQPVEASSTETRLVYVALDGEPIFSEVVGRTTLDQWLQDLKQQNGYKNICTVAELIDQIHRHGVARDVFMTLFRDSDQLKEQMSSEDAREVFVSVLLGEADLSKELFAEVCHEYSTSLPEVLGCELA